MNKLKNGESRCSKKGRFILGKPPSDKNKSFADVDTPVCGC
jgi:hypothetical protein